jgi:hypothetical protein
MKRLLFLVAIVVLVACQGPSTSATKVDLYEFEIEPSISNLVAGTVTLDVTNEGDYGHTLVITDSEGHVLSAGDVIDSGEASELSIDLAAGDYFFTCRIVAQDDDGNVIDHYEQGMSAEVTVAAS